VVIGTTIIVLVQLTILITWTAVDPFTDTLVIGDEWEMIATRLCSSAKIVVWFSVESTFWFILLIFGIYVVYSTWNMRKEVDDARLISMAIYICVVLIGISFPLLGSVMTDDSGQAIWATVFLLSITVCLTGAIYIPKLYRMKKQKKAKSPSLSSSNAKNSVSISMATAT